MKRAIGLVAAVSLTLGLAGCAGNTKLPTASPTPSATLVTGAAAMSDLKKIMKASIAQAEKTGITQTTTNSKYGIWTLVLDRQYSDSYQAAGEGPDGKIDLIYEADAFVPYALSTSLGFKGTKVSELGSEFTVTEIIENTPQTSIYSVSGGLIVREEYTDSSKITVTSDVLYQVRPLQLQILKKAIAALKND